MIEGETLLLFLVLLVGVNLIFAILIKAALERLGIPPLVGYLLLGIAMGLINSLVYFLTPSVKEVYGFLAELGIISLLFRVGLESNLAGSQVPQVWVLRLLQIVKREFDGYKNDWFCVREQP